jgi:chemotaxis signal transduction protein
MAGLWLLMSSQLLLFLVEGQNFVLPLPVVQRVVGAVAIAELPHAPRGVSGIINVHGNVMPVLDVRCVLGFPCGKWNPRPLYFVLLRGLFICARGRSGAGHCERFLQTNRR